MIARWHQCDTMTSQMLARASFSAVCLTVFPFVFQPRTFTNGFYGKKSFISELMILECSFPLRLKLSDILLFFFFLAGGGGVFADFPPLPLVVEQQLESCSVPSRGSCHHLKIGPPMGHVQIHHSSHEIAFQSIHSGDEAGWQAKNGSRLNFDHHDKMHTDSITQHNFDQQQRWVACGKPRVLPSWKLAIA